MARVRLLALTLSTHPSVYDPADDSLLLATSLDARPGDRCLDIGTGTGIAALVMARAGGHVVATDLSPLACALARANASANHLAVDLIQADLASPIAGTFDLVACNPPYLPTAPEDHVRGVLDRALSGGSDGARETRRVLQDLPRLLAADGRAYLLVSSLQPLTELRALALTWGIVWKEVARAPFGLEHLVCVRLTRT